MSKKNEPCADETAELYEAYLEARRQMQRKYKLPNERGIAGMFEDMGLNWQSPEFSQAAARYINAYLFWEELKEEIE